MTTNPLQELPELPTLDEGIHLLEIDSRTSGASQSLVVDHLLTHGGVTEAVWVDSQVNGSTEQRPR